MTSRPSLLFVFGLGYTAQQLASRLMAAGWQVAGTVRSEKGAQALRARGIDARVWAGEGPLEVPGGAHWLITLPPGKAGCPAVESVLNCPGVSPEVSRSVTYLSTTGVYGDVNGGWVTEWSPVSPGSARGRARVLAEQQWSGLVGDRLRLVRLPGIYGPGRSAFDKLRDGSARRIVKAGQVFCRVHVDDIASGLEAMLYRPDVSGVFHLCDDQPAPPQDVTAFAAELLGMAPPPEIPFDSAALSPMAASFYAECKRVSNARAKAALGWRPAYPTYREGLTAILAAETAG